MCMHSKPTQAAARHSDAVYIVLLAMASGTGMYGTGAKSQLISKLISACLVLIWLNTSDIVSDVIGSQALCAAFAVHHPCSDMPLAALPVSAMQSHAHLHCSASPACRPA